MKSFTFKISSIVLTVFYLSLFTLSSHANDLRNIDNPPFLESSKVVGTVKKEVQLSQATTNNSTTEGLHPVKIHEQQLQNTRNYPTPASDEDDDKPQAPITDQSRNGNKQKYLNSLQAFDKSISIFASSSLTNIMQKIIREYTINSNVSVNTIFDSPSELAISIENGEAADVYISETPKMVDLQQKGLIDGFNISALYSDSLVVVIPKNHNLLTKIGGVKDPKTVLEIIISNDLLVLPDPSFDPAGFFAQKALETYNLWDDVKGKLYRAGNTRSALYLISKGNRPGIVYKSDAKADDEVEIIAEIPEEVSTKITYKAAVIAGENMAEARKFIEYLKSPEAKKIFLESGLKE